MNDTEKILKVAKENGGTITTEQVNNLNIHRGLFTELVKKGFLERSCRGVYILPNQFDDELYNFQVRFKKGVFQTAPPFIF